MKSKSKTKPRAPSQIALLQSIDRRLQVIAKNTEPLIVGSSEMKMVIHLDAKARFIKLDADGKPLPAAAKSWAAVRDTKLGLDWSAEDVAGGERNWADAKTACEQLTLCGTKNWRLPTVEELFLLADRTRREPAIDVAFFPTCKSAWYWTSSPYAGDSDDAWIVSFSGGGSGWDFHGHRYYVRACRPSQS